MSISTGTAPEWAIGRFSAEQAHLAAVDRMGYLFAQIETAAGFIARVKAAARHLKAASSSGSPRFVVAPVP